MTNSETGPSGGPVVVERDWQQVNSVLNREILKVVLLDGNERVLDVGTGPAGLALDLLGVYPELEVVGIDLSPERLSYAQERQRLFTRREWDIFEKTQRFHLAQADGRGLPFAEGGGFGAVFCRNVLKHAGDQEERLAIIREMHRVLRPGGQLVLMETLALDFGHWRTLEAVSSLAEPAQGSFWLGYRFERMMDKFMRELGSRHSSRDGAVLFSVPGTLNDWLEESGVKKGSEVWEKVMAIYTDPEHPLYPEILDEDNLLKILDNGTVESHVTWGIYIGFKR